MNFVDRSVVGRLMTDVCVPLGVILETSSTFPKSSLDIFSKIEDGARPRALV